MVIGINCGHTVSGTTGSGAVGYLNESDETRAIGYPLMRMLREQGNVVIDCTDDKSTTVNKNLRRICELANAQPLDMFISIHFNSGGGKGSEVFTYGGKDTADAGKILKALKALGFTDRGIKDGSKLYVIKNTNAPAALVEICFVDTKSDTELYRKLGAEAIAAAICSAITGKNNDTEKEDLTVAQYEELKKMITELTEKVELLADDIAKLKNPMIYNYIDENMPDWAVDTVKKLVAADILKGNGDGLALTEEMLRILVMNDRAGLYD